MRGRVTALALTTSPAVSRRQNRLRSCRAGDFDLDDVASPPFRSGRRRRSPSRHVARPQREIFRQLHDERLDAEDLRLVRKRLLSVPSLSRWFPSCRGRRRLVHGPIGLKWSAFLARHSPRSALPAAFADIVADSVAEPQDIASAREVFYFLPMTTPARPRSESFRCGCGSPRLRSCAISAFCAR